MSYVEQHLLPQESGLIRRRSAELLLRQVEAVGID